MKFSRTTVLGAASLLAAVSGTSLRAEGIAKEEPPMWANVGRELTCKSDGFQGGQLGEDGVAHSFSYTVTQVSIDALDDEAQKVRFSCADVINAIEDWEDAHQAYLTVGDIIPWHEEIPGHAKDIVISDQPIAGLIKQKTADSFHPQ